MARKPRRYRPEGRYSDDSSIAVDNRLDAKRYGPAKGRRIPWSQEDMDKVLEGYLVLKMTPTGPKSLYTYVGRTRDGTGTQVRKFGIAHGDKEQSYHGVNRTDRTGWPVTGREMHLIQLAVAPSGRKRGAHHADYLARVLARSLPDMKRILNRLGKTTNMFGFKETGRKGESPEDVLATQIHIRLDGKKFGDYDVSADEKPKRKP